MLISHSHSRPCNFPPLFLNGSNPERVSHFKYLGVWISYDLSRSKHIESICSKSCRSLGYNIRTFLPHCDPAAVLSSQVLPVLEYACVVWDPHLKKDQLLLESVQLFAGMTPSAEQPRTPCNVCHMMSSVLMESVVYVHPILCLYLSNSPLPSVLFPFAQGCLIS